MGLAGNVIDPLGNVQLYDRNSNGLATVAVDQVNRNTQYSLRFQGQRHRAFCTKIPITESYTYNSDSEPLTLHECRTATRRASPMTAMAT